MSVYGSVKRDKGEGNEK
ncbi:Protein of unknown function [Bacillus mycoides]|nr:Protein of unknown function [Bacillus mycoides]